MGEATTAVTQGRSGLDESPGWLAELASVLAQATRVAVRLRPDGLLELSDRGDVLGYIEYVEPVYVAHVGECPQFAVEVGQRATLAAAVDDVRRHQSAVLERR